MQKQLLGLFLFSSAVLFAGCGGGSNGGSGDPSEPPQTSGSKGLVFVAQTPNPSGTSDIGTHTATFGNSTPGISAAPRGGSLMFLRSDGTLVDLLDSALKNGCDAGGSAICDENGVRTVNDDGLLVGGYVARRPRVHWKADKLVFAMTRGAKDEQHGAVKPEAPRWQLYEIAGLDPEDTPLLTRVAKQPDYNNVDPVYGSGSYIFFISDKPVTGNPDHYPQRDEYESLPINTGLWRLDTKTGDVVLMDHSPSGDFGPEITPDGHVIFTRWDHLQQDQQSIDNSVASVITDRNDSWQAYTYESEEQSGDDKYTLVSDFTRQKLQAWVDNGKQAVDLQAAATGMEMFPETVRGNPFHDWSDNAPAEAGVFVDSDGNHHTVPNTLPSTEYGAYNPLRFNHFLPWQIRQDGLLCETYRHTGLHENVGFVRKALLDDPRITNIDSTRVRIPDGFFLSQVHEDAASSEEIVTGVVAPEFGTHKAGVILQFVDTQTATKPALHENGDAVDYRFLTNPEDDRFLYRDPVFLSDGQLVAAVSRNPGPDDRSFGAFNFTLHTLKKNSESGFHEPAEKFLADGVVQAFGFWEENGGIPKHEFSGRLWEIEMQEVIERAEPSLPGEPALESPELDAFAAAGVTPAAFRDYLAANNLAAIVVRNATSRDEADVLQPFNLVVARPDGSTDGTAKTVHTDFQPGTDRLYPITYLQLMRADYLRGYLKFADFDGDRFVSDNGRRVLPKPLVMAGDLGNNLDVEDAAPDGAVPIAEDGSIAALVPALRAMTWQTTDNDGDPVVRERYWLTFQPGEVRVCASCHGINDKGQDGGGKPQNSPEALRLLLLELKNAGKL